MNTQFLNQTNPWTSQKMTKANQPVKSPRIIDASALSICNDPPPVARTIPEGKYTAIFNSLQFDQRLKCPTGSAGKIGQQLRKHLEKKKAIAKVTSTENYGDGMGGVWMLRVEAPKKLKAA
jgi:hypothetical protein